MNTLTNPDEDIQTGEGLNLYLARDLSRPLIPTPAELAELDDMALERLNAARRRYMTDGLTVVTPAVADALAKTKAVMKHNSNAWTGRRGVLITGDAATGKTRACMAVMRSTFTRFQVENPSTWQDFYPVAYVCVPPKCNSKVLMRLLATFYAIDYVDRTSEDTLRRMVIAAMRAQRTVLIVIDEIHNLVRMDGEAGAVIDALKDLANRPHGTFLYAGVHVARTGMLSGARGAQIRGRFSGVRTGKFSYRTPGERALWTSIVATFAAQLPLAANDPGVVVALAPWLHERTGGSVATLQFILDQVVTDLIEAHDGAKEAVTRDLLERANVDIIAEEIHQGAAFPYEVVG